MATVLESDPHPSRAGAATPPPSPTDSTISPDTAQVRAQSTLDASQHAAVLALADRCARVDRVEPLCEQTLLRMTVSGCDVQFALLATDSSGELLGYVQADHVDDGLGAEIVVAPEVRGHGLGSRLLDEVVRRAPATGMPELHLWARGDLPAAQHLAQRHAATVQRVLLELEHPLTALPAPRLADGVRLRPFQPGRDDAQWLALHNAAFSWHPEQAAWTQHDLALRLEQPWFRADGFLLAEDADGLCGFIWARLRDDLDGAPEGEIYIVAVAPRAQGRGLGRALTLVGLHWMHRNGARQARLFVESDNAAARTLYDSLGFHLRRTHVRYHVPLPSTAP